MDNNIKTSIGERIKFLRHEKGLTQKELSNICHVDRSTITQYESNLIYPSQDVQNILSNFFNVSLDFLNGTSILRSKKVYKLNNDSYIDVPLYNINSNEIINNILLPSDKVALSNFMFVYSPCDLIDCRINVGDLLLIEKASTYSDGDILLLKYNNAFILAKVLNSPPNIILYNNNLFNNGFLTIKNSLINIIGSVTEVTFKIKK
ncbi:helix-turn-helix domain-containing protein [Clostridium hydrogeniformans]|uniref:helix-turn-helix domain-containing protein n=1 Tax=Clostridium hydrogeniformans TaxID=349933 RepID=UPI000689E56B|nr:helix-turn-helix transcriptional regulator [Clostridium hydrogeniformans]